MVAPQSTSEEGMAVFSIIVASLIVGTEERGYSESGSDSTMAPNALTDSFFTSFAFLTDSNLPGQSAAVWPTLILRHQKQPLVFLKYSRSVSLSLVVVLVFPGADLVEPDEGPLLKERAGAALDGRVVGERRPW